MKTKTLIILFFAQAIWGFCFQKSNAQVTSGDSLALVDLYNSTSGPGWINQNNWLSASPVGTWYGVGIEDFRVKAIILPGNNLTGFIPTSINSLLQLEALNIRSNNLNNLPDLGPNDNLMSLEMQDNFFEFDDVINGAAPNPSVFLYAPQRPYFVEQYFFREPGTSMLFNAPAGGFDNIYTWFKGAVQVSGPSVNSTFLINSVTPADAGDYHCEVRDVVYPDLTLISEIQHLTVDVCEDDLGGPFVCQQMIVKFEPGTSQFTKDSLRNVFGAIKIDSCLCDFLELWDVPDSLGIEETVANSKKKAEVEESGLNYSLDVGPPFVNVNPPDDFPFFEGNPNQSETNIKVALIDSGIQYNHPALFDRIWQNPGEYGANPSVDDDGNCLIDDEQGYNFPDESNTPYDIHGHGTHLAGIITNGAPVEIELINLKVFDYQGKGTLFDAACAVYYAVDKGAKVINASWGYNGEASEILKDAIEYAGDQCGVIFIASAGNSGSNNDIFPHFPSGFGLDNILTVAALDLGETGLAPFSNFGMGTVDIADRGTQINSTLPYDTYGNRDGTSMATAMASRAAAMMFLNNPGASYRGIKQCLFDTYNPIAGMESFLKVGGNIDTGAAESCIVSFPFAGECAGQLQLKVFLEGPYDSAGSQMNDGLRNGEHLPLAQPYNIPPWNYSGPELINSEDTAVTGTDALVDWLLVSFVDSSDVGNAIRIAALLQSDGDVVDVNGLPLRIPTSHGGFVTVAHRNHLAISSNTEIIMDFLPTIVDFTNGSIQTFAPSDQNNVGGTLLMISGDGSRDGSVNSVDLNNHFRPENGTPFDYYTTTADFNLDGAVNSVDLNLHFRANNSKQTQCPFCY